MRTANALLATVLVVLVSSGLTACSSGSPTSPASASASGKAAAAGSGNSKYVMVSPGPAKAAGASKPAGGDPTATVSGSPRRYQKVVEPFSPPGTCKSDGDTLEMIDCILEQVVDVDSTVDSLQLQRFELASVSKQLGILADDGHWLKSRSKTCTAAATSGGSIDQITVAQCLLKASQKRVETLNQAD
jgi:uncharacterized protein YecT (DUF1311 family)